MFDRFINCDNNCNWKNEIRNVNIVFDIYLFIYLYGEIKSNQFKSNQIRINQ